MLCRILSEDDTTAGLRDQIIQLNNNQLLYLEEVISREKQRRQRQNLAQWQAYLKQAEAQGLLPAKGTNKIDD